MNISTAISPIWREYGLSEAEIFLKLRGCGFERLDYDFCPSNASSWLNASAGEWAKRMLGALESAGIRVNLAHISGFDPFTQEALVTRAVTCAGALGIPNAVIPLGYTRNNTRQEYEARNSAYLRRLLHTAEEFNITLLIQHSGSWLEPHYTHHAIELERMMEKLDKPPLLKVSLNVGHMGVADIKPHAEIRLLGSDIKSVDLSDNFGGMPLAVHPERENLGLAPMMGYIDYDRVMQALKDTGYSGFFNLRMDMPRAFDKQSFHHRDSPLALMPAGITGRLHAWSLHIAEHMLKTYGFSEVSA